MIIGITLIDEESNTARRFVVQRCDSIDYGKRVAVAWMGTIKCSIVTEKELTDAISVITFWKLGAILL